MSDTQNAVKKSYLKRMYKAINSHVKEEFSDTIKEGVRNAEDLHGIKIKTQKNLDAIMDDIIKANKKAKSNIRASIDEIRDVSKEAWKQAVAAALNEAKDNAGTGEYSDLDLEDFDLDDDDFFKEFNINLDDEEFESDDEEDEEMGKESYFAVESLSVSEIDGLAFMFLTRLLYILQNKDGLTEAQSTLKLRLESELAKGPNIFMSAYDVIAKTDPEVDIKPDDEETAQAVKAQIQNISDTIANDDIPKLKVGRIGLETETCCSMDGEDDNTLKYYVHSGQVAELTIGLIRSKITNDEELISVIAAIENKINGFVKSLLLEDKSLSEEEVYRIISTTIISRYNVLRVVNADFALMIYFLCNLSDRVIEDSVNKLELIDIDHFKNKDEEES